jgi:hypothetical protein
MSDKSKIREIDKAYFVTLTVIGWIDVFTRRNHKLLLGTLRVCRYKLQTTDKRHALQTRASGGLGVKISFGKLIDFLNI